ncbi:iron complex transport system substrate-binding protein [Limimonas halophila]|uniref:Iron complex transport system substrate-binding protein n=1 Tax=Limimonas halophila TaxID=1082479 RepID=A0A1G7R6R1_9PROT|nr:cobalamin-binding protein [Limimonas halophila]SDG06433.1 iron complex transport system substrate-binding protein [Limimonas halophila]
MPRRIVSLVPNATEIVAALGCGDRLVGRSHECDHPPHVAGLPAVTSARIDSSAASAEIDAQVKRTLGDALSLYDLDRGLLADLRPDLVLTQDRCDVCAVSLADVEAAVAELTGGARLLSLAPARLADVWRDVERVAEAIGVPAAGAELAQALARRVEAVRMATAGRPRPRVAALEWLDPLMAGGHWVPELIAAAGGTDVFNTPGAPAFFISPDDLAAADPDVIVAMPCGFARERVDAELAALTHQPWWTRLRAVRTGRVHAVDANALFSRPGPRLADSAEHLAAHLHPEVMGQQA